VPGIGWSAGRDKRRNVGCAGLIDVVRIDGGACELGAEDIRGSPGVCSEAYR